jgi:hypothetical protein
LTAGRRARPGGTSPLDDVVHWFQDWLGRRRDSLRHGGSLPRAPLRPDVRRATRSVLGRGSDRVSSASFDRAFKAIVAAGDTDESDPVDWSSPPRETMSRTRLHTWLQRWYHETTMETIGGVGEFVRRPWVRVEIGAVRCHLNANTTREGVAEYLALAAEDGSDLRWHVVPGRSGAINVVAVGRGRTRVRGLHLFTDSVFERPGCLGGTRRASEDRRAG